MREELFIKTINSNNSYMNCKVIEHCDKRKKYMPKVRLREDNCLIYIDCLRNFFQIAGVYAIFMSEIHQYM